MKNKKNQYSLVNIPYPKTWNKSEKMWIHKNPPHKSFNKSFNTENELIEYVMGNKHYAEIMFSIVLYNNEYIMDYSDVDPDGFKRPLYFYDILVNSDYLYL